LPSQSFIFIALLSHLQSLLFRVDGFKSLPKIADFEMSCSKKEFSSNWFEIFELDVEERFDGESYFAYSIAHIVACAFPNELIFHLWNLWKFFQEQFFKALFGFRTDLAHI
jgi:hypothetical protein